MALSRAQGLGCTVPAPLPGCPQMVRPNLFDLVPGFSESICHIANAPVCLVTRLLCLPFRLQTYELLHTGELPGFTSLWAKVSIDTCILAKGRPRVIMVFLI